MEKKNAAELLEKYNAGTATEEEKAWVESWYARFEDQAGDIPQEQVEQARQESWRAFERGRGRRLWPRLAAAACLLAAMGTGIYYFTHPLKDTGNVAEGTPSVQDIAPGGNKAVLTLANGQQITLDDAAEGQLASQQGSTITKTANGRIIYSASGAHSRETPSFNTIATPKGGQYQITLPDGTQVWLNAASSLRYPAAFTGPRREVELAGEAYFEVAHNKNKPFTVISSASAGGAQTVEVLGTHFNVNAYADEAATKTTLVEGSVKVTATATGEKGILKPGQQSALGGQRIQVREVDTDEAIAWKNGYFLFNEEDLAGIMRKISRWYDVEVEFKDRMLLAQRFSGTVSRYKNVSQVLKVLELTKAAKFAIEGKKIVVSQ